jgi:hypothetical protein
MGHEVSDTTKCVGRVLRVARNRRKEIEEMIDSIMKKAEDNSQKFLKERGAIKEKVELIEKKKPTLGKRARKTASKDEEEADGSVA